MDVGFEIENLVGDFFMVQAVFNQPRAFDINMLDNQNIHDDSSKPCGGRILAPPAIKLFKGARPMPFVEMLRWI